MDDMKDRMFGYERFGYRWFGYRWFVKHTYSTGLWGPIQIVRRKSQYVRHSQTSIAPYHGYKGLSSMPNMPGYTEDILDTKYSIYKHYRRYSLI